MKTVVTNREVPHLWAHQTQPEGRNGTNSLFFRGDTIYSYGHHFPIAKHITNRRGEKAILFTTRSYGNTTAKHCGQVRNAIPPSATVFHVALQDHWTAKADGSGAVKEYNHLIAEHELKAARARQDYSRSYEIRTAAETREEALAFVKFFGLRNKVVELHSDLGEIRKAAAIDSARKAKLERERKAKLQLEYTAQIEAWLRGEYANLPYGIETMLRVKDGEVETSRGARFPVDHAKRGLALVEAVRAKGEPWQANGHTCHLGHYQIDRIEPNGTVHAGCHVVSWKAIERVKEQVLAA